MSSSPYSTWGAGRLQAYGNPGLAFEPLEAQGRYLADGSIWVAVTGISDDGRALDPVAARMGYAFNWRDDHDDDCFYTTPP